MDKWVGLKSKNFISNEYYDLTSYFLDDLEKLLKKDLKGQEKLFFERFLVQLDYVKTLNKNELALINSNEVLKHCNSFKCYSLHIKKRTFNIRILGTFVSNQFVFLCIFNEKSGKKVSSYKKYITLAEERLNEIKESKKYA